MRLRILRWKSRGPPKKRFSEQVSGMPFLIFNSIRCRVQTRSANWNSLYFAGRTFWTNSTGQPTSFSNIKRWVGVWILESSRLINKNTQRVFRHSSSYKMRWWRKSLPVTNAKSSLRIPMIPTFRLRSVHIISQIRLGIKYESCKYGLRILSLFWQRDCP